VGGGQGKIQFSLPDSKQWLPKKSRHPLNQNQKWTHWHSGAPEQERPGPSFGCVFTG
jgi:hypothetical protein